MDSYEFSDKEKAKGQAPAQLNQYGNAYGTLEMGVNRQGILTVSVHEKSLYNTPISENASKRFRGNQRKFNSSGGSHYYYNSPGEEKSAFVFTEDIRKSEQYIYRNMKRIFRKENSQILEGTLPFLLEREEDSHTEQIIYEQEERRFYKMFRQTVETARRRKLTRQPEPIHYEEVEKENRQDEEDSTKNSSESDSNNQT